MSVSESQRLALHRAARAALGEEEGDTLMELSPPANTDMATRQDVERAEERLGARIDAVAADVRATEERLGGRIDAVAADVRATEERLNANIKASAAEVTAAFTKSLHRSELRIMALIVATFLGSNLLS